VASYFSRQSLVYKGKSLDIKKITNNTNARNSRSSRPYTAFNDVFNSTDKALKEVLDLNVSKETETTLMNSHVINSVTALEVYYKDILDSIFKLCKPSSFEKKLKKLHDKTYKIDDLLDMYVHRIHPLSLIANNLSFQNTYNIDKVFTIIIEEPFFKKIKAGKYRFKDNPEKEFSLEYKQLELLQELFDMRHELIHNPNANYSINKDIYFKIQAAQNVVMFSDFVLGQYISDNIDPEIEEMQDKLKH